MEMVSMAPEDGIVALGARVHLFVKPKHRGQFLSLFRDVLGCAVTERDFGMEHPVGLVSFPDRSAFSVEFTDLAPEDTSEDTIDDAHAFRGAWIEFRTTNVPRYQAELRRAGIREFRHPGSAHVYFSAPGGQVFRLIDLNYEGP
jgi:hypothetical protein